MKAAVVIDSGVLLALWDPDDTQHHAATAALKRHLTDGSRLIVPSPPCPRCWSERSEPPPTPSAPSKAS
jgi:hypothetical protein